MRNLQYEAAIWYLFTSTDFFEEAALECERTMEWFGTLATSRHVANFGRNNQIFDMFKQRARDFRRGAELARLGDYELVWNVAKSIRGDTRGLLEQPLHAWMSEAEYQEFQGVRVSRLLTYTFQISRALNNALIGADGFFNPNPDYPERSNDDDGFPGDKIFTVYRSNVDWYKDESFWKLPDPLPEYVIDESISCKTGDEVPWTGVWHPSTGLEKHSLTFAIRGLRMQPVYRVIKTSEELKAEGMLCPMPQTVAEATSWHPVVLSGRVSGENLPLWAKAGEACPKAGRWRPTDPGASPRNFETGEMMAHAGSPYGFTVWRWEGD